MTTRTKIGSNATMRNQPKFCVCGCTRRTKKGSRYAEGCSPQTDPAWRHARAVAAGHASRARHLHNLAKRAEQFDTKAAAMCHGYRVGYRRAYKKWQQWADALLQQRVRQQAKTEAA
jgi:hypothetical protein